MRAALLTALLIAATSLGCGGEQVDLSKGLEIVDLSTGWYDDGPSNGQNKMVPSVSFKFKNTSNQTLSTLQANVLFRRVGDEAEWASSFVRIVGREGLEPGAASAPQRVKASKGYTGTETAPQMMQNSQFVDARVQIMAKYGATQWKPIGEYVVDRRMIAP